MHLQHLVGFLGKDMLELEMKQKWKNKEKGKQQQQQETGREELIYKRNACGAVPACVWHLISFMRSSFYLKCCSQLGKQPLLSVCYAVLQWLRTPWNFIRKTRINDRVLCTCIGKECCDVLLLLCDKLYTIVYRIHSSSSISHTRLDRSPYSGISNTQLISTKIQNQVNDLLCFITAHRYSNSNKAHTHVAHT